MLFYLRFAEFSRVFRQFGCAILNRHVDGCCQNHKKGDDLFLNRKRGYCEVDSRCILSLD